MIELGLTYLLCLVGAFCLESRLPLNNLLERILTVFTLVAVQLILAVQLLSLFHFLTGGGLLLACLGFALAGLACTFLRPAPSVRRPWGTLLAENGSAFTGANWPVGVVLLSGAALVLVFTAFGAVMFPFADSYHFERPLFWMQNHTIAPFPVPNPRINVTSFADTALELPGCFWSSQRLMPSVITLVAACLSLGVVFSLACKLGCTRMAAACASLVLPVCSVYAVAFLTLNADFYLAALWTGASLLFLMECHDLPGASPKERHTRLGLSLLCLLMACGAKNGTIFLFPFYLAALALIFRGSLFKTRIVAALVLSGLIGLAGSGTAWNYIANAKWYGSTKGPPFMRGLLSHDFQFRSVWTRMARDVSLMAFDVLYVPASHREAYGALCEKAVELLGGQARLPEDVDDGALDFNRTTISPRSAFGLVGIVFFLPAIVAGLWQMRGRGDPRAPVTLVQRLNIAILLICGLGCFLAGHVFFRWQTIGFWRLMPALPVIAAALCGLLFSRRASQLLVLLVVAAGTLAFFAYDAGMMARRYPALADNWLLRKITASARQHGRSFLYRWLDGPWLEASIKEDYMDSEVPQKFLERIEPGATIGFVGDPNALMYYLFGPNFSNRIVPLNDAGALDRLLPPPDDAKYLVIEQTFNVEDNKIAWATNQGYALVFQAVQGTNRMFVGFQK